MKANLKTLIHAERIFSNSRFEVNQLFEYFMPPEVMVEFDEFVRLFEAVSISDDATVRAATTRLEELMCDPQTIFRFVTLATESFTIEVRRMALILIRHYFVNLDLLPDDQKEPQIFEFETLKSPLLQIYVTSPPDLLSISSGAIEIFTKIFLEFSVWPELPLLIASLLTQE
jgi:hypothetical protein